MNKKKFGSLLLALAGIAGGVIAHNNIGHKPAPTPTPVPSAPSAFTLIVHACSGPCALDHKIRDAKLRLGDTELSVDGAGNAEFPGLPSGHDYEVCAAAAGFKPLCGTASLTTPNQELNLELDRDAPPTLHVGVDGRSWTTSAGIFRPVFESGLSLLARDTTTRDAFFDQARELGFNGVRVFAGDLGWAPQTPAGARAALPGFLDAAQARGLYAYVSALQGGGYDVEGHLREVAGIVAAHDNALLEVANEIGHSTQSDLGKDPSRLLGVARRIIPAGVTWTLGAPVDTDEPTPEGRYPTDGGMFNDAHLDRGRDAWNQVRRLREIAAVADSTHKPAMSGEPIGADEQMGGATGTKQRRNDPPFFYAMGALCRGFELGCVFHSEAGLQGQLLGPVQQACARAFIAGWNAMPTGNRLSFVNAGWPGSPVAKANFDSGIVRAYSFLDGGRGWTVLVGVRGDPAVEWGGGWHPVGLVGEQPGVQIIEIGR